ACFMARRKAKRRSSCSAMRCAMRAALVLGFGISWTLTAMVPGMWALSFVLRVLIDSPPRPITTPGLAVWMVTLMLCAALSMSIRDMPEWPTSFVTTARIISSSASRRGYSFGDAYQCAEGTLFTPRRKPTGLILFPTAFLQGYPHVARALAHEVGAATSAREGALESGAVANLDLFDEQPVLEH